MRSLTASVISGLNAAPTGTTTTTSANGQTAPSLQKIDQGKDAKGFARALLDLDKPKRDPNALFSRQVLEFRACSISCFYSVY